MDFQTKEHPFHVYLPPTIYSLWIYMRHHGFPSPLLDWTMSPFVAAFFAFVNPPRSEVERVAVFAYIESPLGIKGGADGVSHISTLGPDVRTHKRHFLQQSCYTICTKYVDGTHRFVPHAYRFNTSLTRQVPQDVLVKITIPISTRICALRNLREMNISRLSLFQTEDALLETLAIEEIDSRGKL